MVWIVVIIIIVILVAALAAIRFTNILDGVVPAQILSMIKPTSSYTMIRDDTKAEKFDTTVRYTLDLVVRTLRKYALIPAEDAQLRSELYAGMKAVFTGDLESSIEPLKAYLKTTLSSYVDVGFQKDVNDEIIPSLERYLMHDSYGRYRFPGDAEASVPDTASRSLAPIFDKDNEGTPISRVYGKEDRISELIKGETSGVMGPEKAKTLSSTNLFSPVRRYGFSPVTKAMNYWDPRGINPGVVTNLLNTLSTNDPNSLQSSGTVNIDDIMKAPGGYGNNSFYRDLEQKYLEKIGDSEDRAFRSLSSRRIIPEKAIGTVLAENTMTNILTDVKSKKYGSM